MHCYKVGNISSSSTAASVNTCRTDFHFKYSTLFLFLGFFTLLFSLFTAVKELVWADAIFSKSSYPLNGVLNSILSLPVKMSLTQNWVMKTRKLVDFRTWKD